MEDDNDEHDAKALKRIGCSALLLLLLLLKVLKEKNWPVSSSPAAVQCEQQQKWLENGKNDKDFSFPLSLIES